MHIHFRHSLHSTQTTLVRYTTYWLISLWLHNYTTHYCLISHTTHINQTATLYTITVNTTPCTRYLRRTHTDCMNSLYTLQHTHCTHLVLYLIHWRHTAAYTTSYTTHTASHTQCTHCNSYWTHRDVLHTHTQVTQTYTHTNTAQLSRINFGSDVNRLPFFQTWHTLQVLHVHIADTVHHPRHAYCVFTETPSSPAPSTLWPASSPASSSSPSWATCRRNTTWPLTKSPLMVSVCSERTGNYTSTGDLLKTARPVLKHMR